MNITRRSRHEDLLFVIALLVPALLAGARFVQTDRQIEQIEQIAQVRSPAAFAVVDSREPAALLDNWA